jgi:hypothetical protein
MGAISRRGFLKKAGLLALGLPFAGWAANSIRSLPVVHKAAETIDLTKGVRSESGRFDFSKADSLTAKVWAKKWWAESKQESYFYKAFIIEG